MSYNQYINRPSFWPFYSNRLQKSVTIQSSNHRKFVILLSFSLIICSATLSCSHLHHHNDHFVDEEYLNVRKELPCGHIPPKLNQIRFAHIGMNFHENYDNNGQDEANISDNTDDDYHHIIHKRNEPIPRYQNLRIKYFYDESVEKITKEKYLIIDVCVCPIVIVIVIFIINHSILSKPIRKLYYPKQ